MLGKAVRICLSAAWAAGVFLAPAAQAAVITYTGAATNIFYNGDDTAFTWQQFDPSAGVLNAVTYSVSGAFTFSLRQTAPFAVQPTYTISKGLTLNGTGLAPQSGFRGEFDTVLNLTRPAGDLLMSGETESQTVLVDFLRAPDFGLASFIGVGTINADLGISEDSDLCYSDALTGSAYHVDCSQTGNLAVSVTYDYTPKHTASPEDTAVPEPAAALLMGLGLAAMAAFRRRKISPALLS